MEREQQHSATASPQSDELLKDSLAIALQNILDPVLELCLDGGLTVQEVNRLLRTRAVRVASERIAKGTGRISKSRIAIITGLPRSEVSKILLAREPLRQKKCEQHLAKRILTHWHEDPRFLNAAGAPAELAIFGKKISFEGLVKKYGSGIPVRAMLDELIELKAIEPVGIGKIRVRTRITVSKTLNEGSILYLGERCGDMIRTLLHNIQKRGAPLFEATVFTEGEPEKLEVAKHEMAERSKSLVAAIRPLAVTGNTRLGKGSTKLAKMGGVGVTVYSFQREPTRGNNLQVQIARRRKNLRRQP